MESIRVRAHDVVEQSQRMGFSLLGRVGSQGGQIFERRVVDTSGGRTWQHAKVAIRRGFVGCDGRGKAAQSRVERGQVSWAREELTGATLKTDETLRELQGRRPQESGKFPLRFSISCQGKLSLLMPLCSASVWPVHLQGLLHGQVHQRNVESLLGRRRGVTALVLGRPGHGQSTDPRVSQNFHACHDDSSPKKDGGVRGIATGTSFRRLVAKTLARQFGKVVESTCAPFQVALGTDCVGHGIGAYDHVLRSAMMSKLCTVAGCRWCHSPGSRSRGR